MFERQPSVAIGVEFGKPVSPELVDLRLDEATVAIGIEGFEHRRAAAGAGRRRQDASTGRCDN